MKKFIDNVVRYNRLSYNHELEIKVYVLNTYPEPVWAIRISCGGHDEKYGTVPFDFRGNGSLLKEFDSLQKAKSKAKLIAKAIKNDINIKVELICESYEVL